MTAMIEVQTALQIMIEAGLDATKAKEALMAAKKTTKKTKTKKDSDTAKRTTRGTNAYFLFLKENRQQIKADLMSAAGDEKVNATLVTKKAGEMWNAIKATDAAAKYHEAAAESRAVAQEGKANTEEAKPKAKKARGTNAYFLFLKENRQQIKEDMIEAAGEGVKVSAIDVSKKAGAMWNAIKNTDEAAKYHEAAADGKQKAQAELDASVPVAPVSSPEESPAQDNVVDPVDILATIKTPTEEAINEGIQAAKENGTWVEGNSSEDEEDEKEEEEDAEEFEHEGVVYLKVADGRLFLVEDDEPQEVGKVTDGEVEIY